MTVPMGIYNSNNLSFSSSMKSQPPKSKHQVFKYLSQPWEQLEAQNGPQNQKRQPSHLKVPLSTKMRRRDEENQVGHCEMEVPKSKIPTHTRLGSKPQEKGESNRVRERWRPEGREIRAEKLKPLPFNSENKCKNLLHVFYSFPPPHLAKI